MPSPPQTHPPIAADQPGTVPHSADEGGAVHRQLAQLRQQLEHAQSALARCRLELDAARELARRDALTGLPNRSGFDTESHRTIVAHGAGNFVLALLFLDLDGFKAVNDELGHAVGDALLRVIGARLANAMRRGDLVCRQGGDEFLCLLPQLNSPDRAQAIAQNLARAIEAPCQIGPHSVTVRASIGVALYPRDGASLPALLGRADRAMYAAKSARCGVMMAGPATADAGVAPASCGSALSRQPPGRRL